MGAEGGVIVMRRERRREQGSTAWRNGMIWKKWQAVREEGKGVGKI